MRCPHCGLTDSRVTNSRTAENGIRRRRECLNCNGRFTTYERVHSPSLMVTKQDNSREEFDREKLAGGIRKACTKRPVSADQIETMVDDIEGAIQGMGEVSASQLGEAVMERLRGVDRVAYIRFASVYRDFQDIESFEAAVKDLREGRGTQLTLPHIEPGPTRKSQTRPGGRNRRGREAVLPTSATQTSELGAGQDGESAVGVETGQVTEPEPGPIGESESSAIPHSSDEVGQ